MSSGEPENEPLSLSMGREELARKVADAIIDAQGGYHDEACAAIRVVVEAAKEVIGKQHRLGAKTDDLIYRNIGVSDCLDVVEALMPVERKGNG